MGEEELYPDIREFLINQKNCFPEYCNFELYLSELSRRIDVFGISKENGGEKVIYLSEGKKELLKNKNFAWVIGEVLPLQRYGDYVYVFGAGGDFEDEDKAYVEECKRLGVGILLFDERGKIDELLEPVRNDIESSVKQKMLLKIFLRDTSTPIADLIFQGVYEYAKLKSDTALPSAKFIDVYNCLFKNEACKEAVRSITGYHTLKDIDVRRAFQREYGGTPYVEIERMGSRLDDFICITEEGMKMVREPILLD